MAGEPYYFNPEDPNSNPVDLSAIQIVPPAGVMQAQPVIDDVPPTEEEYIAANMPDYARGPATSAFIQNTPAMPAEGAGEWAMPRPADLQAGQDVLPEAEGGRPDGLAPGAMPFRQDTKKETTTKTTTAGQRPLDASEEAGMAGIDQALAGSREREGKYRAESLGVRGAMRSKEQAFQENMAMIEERRAKALDAAQKNIDATSNDLGAFKFQDFFSSRGAASGIAAMLGMAAAGFLQGWTSGKVNMMPMFEKMIDQDFQKQKAEYDRLKSRGIEAQNAYGRVARSFDDLEDRKLAFNKSAMDQLNKQLVDLRAGMRDENSDRFALEALKADTQLRDRQYGRTTKTVEEKVTNQMRYKYAGLGGAGGGGEPQLAKGEQVALENYIKDVEKAGVIPAKRYAYRVKNLLADPEIQAAFGRFGSSMWDRNAMMAGVGAEMMKNKEFAQKYTALMQATAGMENQKIQDRAGRAVSEHEMARVMQELRGSGSYEDRVNAISEYLGFMRDWDDLAQVRLSDNARNVLEYRYNRGQGSQSSPVFSSGKSSTGGAPPTGKGEPSVPPTGAGAPGAIPPKPKKPIPDDLFGPPKK